MKFYYASLIFITKGKRIEKLNEKLAENSSDIQTRRQEDK